MQMLFLKTKMHIFLNKITIPEIFYLKEEKILLSIIIIQSVYMAWSKLH